MKTCKFCGQEIKNEDKFCSFCGAAVEDAVDSTPQEQGQGVNPPESVANQTQPEVAQPDGQVTAQPEQTLPTTSSQPTNEQPPVKRKFSGMGIAGFVVSLVGLFFAAIVCGTIGIILSSAAFGETKQGAKRGRGLAIAGLVVGIIDVITFFVLL